MPYIACLCRHSILMLAFKLKEIHLQRYIQHTHAQHNSIVWAFANTNLRYLSGFIVQRERESKLTLCRGVVEENASPGATRFVYLAGKLL